MGSIANVLRISLGDFDFGAANYLTEDENILFWALWALVVVLTNVIFMNFIIAEASASYEKVTEWLDAEVLKAKAELITEAEEMTFKSMKSSNKYPRYIIIRS